ncbi:urea amidolyase associated protein UAAP1 [Cellulomonas endophytica]|uniref:urea amidolyase associated protein UAAP1 n=1 Tax=Cellulomonas endophytica TaxID=2494735 RepID=UPI00101077EF|nr:urea amidolyase associated protein UAAP1 [Cellulomonas endophytica]
MTGTAIGTGTTGTGTGTTAGARAHAREQEGSAAAAAVAERPWLPAPAAPVDGLVGGLPDGVGPADLVWAERVAAGGYTHRELARGTHVRLTDVTGEACASVLLFSAGRTHERLNVADTVKVQWQVYPGAGYLLLSDQGRVLASLVEDTSGRHDAVFGTSTAARNAERYGDGSLQGPSPAGRELLVLAAAKHGLTRRDVAPCVSFFQGVRVDEAGAGVFEGSAGPGASLVLRAEMPLVLLVANTAHPLDPRPAWTCGPVEVTAWRGTPTTPDDPLWDATPEGRRAFVNTADHLTARGTA